MPAPESKGPGSVLSRWVCMCQLKLSLWRRLGERVSAAEEKVFQTILALGLGPEPVGSPLCPSAQH